MLPITTVSFLRVFTVSKGLFTWWRGTPGGWGKPLRWANPLYGLPTYHVNVFKWKWEIIIMDRRVTPPKRFTLPTSGPPRSCKQDLSWSICGLSYHRHLLSFPEPWVPSFRTKTHWFGNHQEKPCWQGVWISGRFRRRCASSVYQLLWILSATRQGGASGGAAVCLLWDAIFRLGSWRYWGALNPEPADMILVTFGRSNKAG